MDLGNIGDILSLTEPYTRYLERGDFIFYATVGFQALKNCSWVEN